MTLPIASTHTPRTRPLADASATACPAPTAGAAPPRTAATTGAAPSRNAPVRDDFGPATGAAPGRAQGTSGPSANGQPSLRQSIEHAQRMVEAVPLPPALAPCSRPPARSLSATIQQQRATANEHARDGAVNAGIEGLGMVAGTASEMLRNSPRGASVLRSTVARLVPGAPIIQSAASALGVAREVRADLHAGRSLPASLLDRGLTALTEHVMHGAAPLVAGGRATIEASAHILHDGRARREVAGAESRHAAELAQIARTERFSRMDGRIAANAVGNASAPPTSRIDMQRLQTDRAYALAVREGLAERARTAAP